MGRRPAGGKTIEKKRRDGPTCLFLRKGRLHFVYRECEPFVVMLGKVFFFLGAISLLNAAYSAIQRWL
jgi:hypothetical protein